MKTQAQPKGMKKVSKMTHIEYLDRDNTMKKVSRLLHVALFKDGSHESLEANKAAWVKAAQDAIDCNGKARIMSIHWTK